MKKTIICILSVVMLTGCGAGLEEAAREQEEAQHRELVEAIEQYNAAKDAPVWIDFNDMGQSVELLTEASEDLVSAALLEWNYMLLEEAGTYSEQVDALNEMYEACLGCIDHLNPTSKDIDNICGLLVEL